MPGFEESRFYDLSEREANTLVCIICHKILDNAMLCNCENSYCKGCVEGLIRSRQYNCPECKTGFTKKRKRNVDKQFLVIAGHLFKPNFMANKMIRQLKAKCDFEFNGCQERVVFGAMATHLKECEHRICATCGLNPDINNEHNCLEMLKQYVNELKTQLDRLKKMKFDPDCVKTEDFSKERDELINNMESIKRERDALKNELSQSKTQNALFKSKCDLLYDDLKSLKSEQAAKRMRTEYSSPNSKAVSEQIKSLEKHVNKYKNESKDWKLKYNESCAQNTTVLEKIDHDWKVKYKDLDDKNTNLLEQIETLKSKHNKAIELNSKATEKLKDENKRLDRILSANLRTTKEVLKTNSNLTKEVESLEDFTKRSYHYKSILIGTYNCKGGWLNINAHSLKLFKIPKNGIDAYSDHIFIPFLEVQELFYCTDRSFPAIVIKPIPKLCKVIQNILHIGSMKISKFKDVKIFDVESKDPKNWYIIIAFENNMSEQQRRALIAFLDYKSTKYENNIMFKGIDLDKYKKLVKNSHNPYVGH